MVALKNYAETTGQGVVTSLSTVTISQKMVDYFVERREDWRSFGKMNSHLYRMKLFMAMDAKKLSPEARMIVFAMASIIKSQPRIIQAMTDMPEEQRFTSDGVWFSVRSFYETECTQYVSTSKRNQKFPVVNLPTTMPGLDIFWWAVCTEDSERTLSNLKLRPTFTQMDLQADVQTVAREGYETFWNKVVKGTRNTDKVDAPKMREEFYENSASDKYRFVRMSAKGGLEILNPQMTSKGYSLAEVNAYLKSFNASTPGSSAAQGSPGPKSQPSASR